MRVIQRLHFLSRRQRFHHLVKLVPGKFPRRFRSPFNQPRPVFRNRFLPARFLRVVCRRRKYVRVFPLHFVYHSVHSVHVFRVYLHAPRHHAPRRRPLHVVDPAAQAQRVPYFVRDDAHLIAADNANASALHICLSALQLQVVKRASFPNAYRRKCAAQLLRNLLRRLFRASSLSVFLRVRPLSRAHAHETVPRVAHFLLVSPYVIKDFQQPHFRVQFILRCKDSQVLLHVRPYGFQRRSVSLFVCQSQAVLHPGSCQVAHPRLRLDFRRLLFVDVYVAVFQVFSHPRDVVIFVPVPYLRFRLRRLLYDLLFRFLFPARNGLLRSNALFLLQLFCALFVSVCQLLRAHPVNHIRIRFLLRFRSVFFSLLRFRSSFRFLLRLHVLFSQSLLDCRAHQVRKDRFLVRLRLRLRRLVCFPRLILSRGRFIHALLLVLHPLSQRVDLVQRRLVLPLRLRRHRSADHVLNHLRRVVRQCAQPSVHLSVFLFDGFQILRRLLKLFPRLYGLFLRYCPRRVSGRPRPQGAPRLSAHGRTALHRFRDCLFCNRFRRFARFAASVCRRRHGHVLRHQPVFQFVKVQPRFHLRACFLAQLSALRNLFRRKACKQLRVCACVSVRRHLIYCFIVRRFFRNLFQRPFLFFFFPCLFFRLLCFSFRLLRFRFRLRRFRDWLRRFRDWLLRFFCWLLRFCCCLLRFCCCLLRLRCWLRRFRFRLLFRCSVPVHGCDREDRACRRAHCAVFEHRFRVNHAALSNPFHVRVKREFLKDLLQWIFHHFFQSLAHRAFEDVHAVFSRCFSHALFRRFQRVRQRRRCLCLPRKRVYAQILNGHRYGRARRRIDDRVRVVKASRVRFRQPALESAHRKSGVSYKFSRHVVRSLQRRCVLHAQHARAQRADLSNSRSRLGVYDVFRHALRKSLDRLHPFPASAHVRRDGLRCFAYCFLRALHHCIAGR